MLKRLVAGNWKMNGLRRSLEEAKQVAADLAQRPEDCDVVICPPATLIALLKEGLGGSSVLVGGQDCHTAQSGAHTGDISAEMLRDAGCSYVIIGHSERRTDHGETNQLVREKALALKRAGIIPIICIGETLAEREAGQTLAVLESQLRGSLPSILTGHELTIAYEPVWAIGTGLVPEADDIVAAHEQIRDVLADAGIQDAQAVRILYGGSVKPENASHLLSLKNVNGALVGGASLKADDFLGIIRA